MRSEASDPHPAGGLDCELYRHTRNGIARCAGDANPGPGQNDPWPDQADEEDAEYDIADGLDPS
jgi:hypothetical protein